MSGGTTCKTLEAKCQHEPKSTSWRLKKYSNTTGQGQSQRASTVSEGNPKGHCVRRRYLTCPCRLVLLLCPLPVCRRTYAVEAERSTNRCNALLSGISSKWAVANSKDDTAPDSLYNRNSGAECDKQQLFHDP